MVRKRPELSLEARAMQYLARREHSRAELAAKLQPYLQLEDEFDQLQPFDLNELLDDLVRRGYLSDDRAAAQLLHCKRQRFGTQRLVHELRQKGIGEELIAEALPALKESELEAARTVWQRKFGVPPADAKDKARQVRFMQSRGFGFDVIFKLLQACDEETCA